MTLDQNNNNELMLKLFEVLNNNHSRWNKIPSRRDLKRAHEA